MGLFSEDKKAVPRKAIIEALKKTEDPSFLNRMNAQARVQFGEETFPVGHELIKIEEYNGKIRALESERFDAENQKEKSIAEHKIRLLKKIR